MPTQNVILRHQPLADATDARIGRVVSRCPTLIQRRAYAIRTGSSIATLHNVQDFLTTHADTLGGLAASGGRKKLDEIAASLDRHGREQEDRALAARVATVRRVTRERRGGGCM